MSQSCVVGVGSVVRRRARFVVAEGLKVSEGRARLEGTLPEAPASKVLTRNKHVITYIFPVLALYPIKIYLLNVLLLVG